MLEMLQTIFQYIANFFTTIYEFISKIWDYLYIALKWLFDAFMTGISEFFYLMVDGFFTAVETFISGLDFSSYILNITGVWDLLPTQLSYIISQCGITQGLTMLAGAYTLRMLLNLIPAALTRI